ncbi:MAG: hypothetical protein J6X77_01655 [Bacteroidales bacterium]|nr:hypothetical protein [Bacteroidales bacterium]
MKQSFAEIIAAERREATEKVLAKVPEWAGIELTVPSRLASEQCSSAATAQYKAKLLNGCKTVADLTGGLGVDSWAFAQKAVRVYHNELNAELSAAVRHNFGKLGVSNVEFSSQDAAEMLESLPPVDAIYMDPSRRDGAGKKVFLVEDCRPDVLGLLPALLGKAPLLLVKLSPMADLTMLRERFSPNLKELHVVSSGGEVKELLLLLTREPNRNVRIVATDLRDRLEFTPEEELSALAVCPRDEAGLRGKLLFEPDPAITKAGAFKLPCVRYGLTKLARFTHLYIAETKEAFGKYYTILDVFDWGRAGMKECASKYPFAEVSARNVPMSSDELRSRLKVRPDADIHIFGVALDLPEGPVRRLIAAKRDS